MKRTLLFVLLVVGNLSAQTYDTNNVVVQTFTGSGFSGWVDGVGTQTMFSGPKSIVAASQGTFSSWTAETNESEKSRQTEQFQLSRAAGRAACRDMERTFLSILDFIR